MFLRHRFAHTGAESARGKGISGVETSKRDAFLELTLVLFCRLSSNLLSGPYAAYLRDLSLDTWQDYWKSPAK
jgi:hypothetical protein